MQTTTASLSPLSTLQSQLPNERCLSFQISDLLITQQLEQKESWFKRTEPSSYILFFIWLFCFVLFTGD